MTISAPRDDNRIPSLIGSSTTTGAAVAIGADPVTNRLLVDSNAASGFGIFGYDYIAATYPAGDTEVYTFKSGGAAGTTIATLTVVYTDTTKDNISTVTKS